MLWIATVSRLTIAQIYNDGSQAAVFFKWIEKHSNAPIIRFSSPFSRTALTHYGELPSFPFFTGQCSLLHIGCA